MKVQAIALLMFFSICLWSCSKNNDTTVGGKTGVATLLVIPAVPANGGYLPVDPGGMVYIKYNTTSFPGSNTSLYDDSMKAEINYPNPYTQTAFQGLSNGSYYLYFVGTHDKVINTSGGMAVTIVKQTGHSEAVVYVHP
jgi:hypothetical protein